MLSPFQERVARIVAELAEAEDFALAGGAALIVRGDVDRRTRDLDFFGRSAIASTGSFLLPSGHWSVKVWRSSG